MATSKERVIQTKEKIAKKLALIEKYQNQIEKKTNEIKSKGWNPEDRYCHKNEPDYHESYWAICDLEDKIEAKKSALKSLDDLQKILEGWEEKAKKEEEKNLIVQEMPEIFSDLKKQLSDKWYEWDIKERDSVRKAYDEYRKQISNLPKFSSYKEEFNAKRKIEKTLIFDCFTKYSISLRFMSDEDIRKNDDKDAESSIIELYYHVLDVTGKVTGWSDIKIVGGTINGIIEGEEGKAKVETILVGGWNIQRLHFRTLVHKIGD